MCVRLCLFWGVEYVELSNLENNELVELIISGVEVDASFEQLLRNLRPMIFKIAYMYLRRIPIYDEDDYLQEGLILIWKLISTGKVKPDFLFSNLFYTAFQRRCINIFRDYVLKNGIFVSCWERGQEEGYTVGYFIADAYVEKYRLAQRERNKRYYEKTHPEALNKPKPPTMTEEERIEHRRQKSREYYETHKEQCRQSKRDWYQKNREYALSYQKAYAQGVRIGHKGPVPKRRKRDNEK